MIFLLAMPVLLAAQAPALTAPAPPSADKAVITVNGHPILAKDVAAYLWDWSAPQVGQALITRELVEQEATKRSVKATDAEVSARVQDFYRQMATRLPKGTDITDYLRKQGAPSSRVALELRVQVLLEKLTQQDFKLDDYVRVATVLIRPKDQTSTSLSAALKAANDAYAGLKKGDDWEKIVTQYTTEQRAAANHGELGWLSINEFPKEIAGDIATLKLNGYTQPVQTGNGIQI